MWYVAAYDISESPRRERIAELLGRYGSRVQLSVFEVQLDENELELVLAAVGEILEAPEERKRPPVPLVRRLPRRLGGDGGGRGSRRRLGVHRVGYSCGSSRRRQPGRFLE